MTSVGYHNTGEEWSHKNDFRQDEITRDTSFEILLYNDGTDELDDSSDIGDITTEPDDGEYARQTQTLDSDDFPLSVADGDIRTETEVVFDTTDTTGEVDAYAVVVNFQSDVVNSETEANPHLLTSSAFDDGSSRDLGQFEELTVTVRIDKD